MFSFKSVSIYNDVNESRPLDRPITRLPTQKRSNNNYYVDYYFIVISSWPSWALSVGQYNLTNAKKKKTKRVKKEKKKKLKKKLKKTTFNLSIRSKTGKKIILILNIKFILHGMLNRIIKAFSFFSKWIIKTTRQLM